MMQPTPEPPARTPAHAHGPEHHAHDGHAHGHTHTHAHDLREVGRRRLAWVLAMTAAFTVVEFVGGWLSNSLALIADAGHMLSDVAALGLAVFALWFARRPANAAKSFGYLRTEILAALANGVALVVIAILIIMHAWQRLRVPEPVEGGLMLAVATGGLLVNIIAAVLLHDSSTHSLNVRGAYLHVLGDMLGSVGAITAALLIMLTGWLAADPIISVFVALLILVGSWRLVRESVDVLLEAVPRDIELAEVYRTICGIPGVEEIHDLHVWTITSGMLAMSAHVIAPAPDGPRILREIHQRMHDRFGIRHVTVQVEPRPVYPIRTRAEAEALRRDRPAH